MISTKLGRRTTWAIVSAVAFLGAVSPRQATSSDLDVAVAGHNRFSLDLYRNLASKNDDNLVFSPLSVSTALSMVLAGARTSTADEMNAALHVTLPSQQYHAAVGGVLGALNSSSPDFELSIANRLWAQQGASIRDEYLDVTHAQYGAGLESLDFISATEPARQTINQWVEERTHDKIRELIPRGALTPETALVLTNAIYFNGKWARPFDAETRAAPFSLANGEQRPVTMMRQTSYLRHATTADFEMLELPYRGGDQSLLVLLPRETDGLPALEANLTMDLLDQTAELLQPAYVAVNLPQFKLDSMLGLNATLKELGIRQLFDESADLSGISPGDLSVDSVIHKAIIEVDTEGTTAAAATAVIIGVTCACPPPTPILFNADHPFLFALRDNRTDSILFMGRLTEPETFAAIPEPGTALLGLAAAAVAMAVRGNRRRVRP